MVYYNCKLNKDSPTLLVRELVKYPMLIVGYIRELCYNINESEVILLPKINYITKERYEYLNMLIKASNLSINFNTGLITGSRGGHGYINNHK